MFNDNEIANILKKSRQLTVQSLVFVQNIRFLQHD